MPDNALQMDQGARQHTQHATAPARDRIEQLVMLDRLPRGARPAAVGFALVAAVLWGVAMLKVQQHLSALRDSGDGLSGGATLLANGTAPVTVISGWIAALFFAGALLRLRRGAPEPPVTRGNPEHHSVAELRSGLRREHRVVTAGLLAVTALALLDTGRLVVAVAASVGGSAPGRGAPIALLAETAGLVMASVFLGWWTAAFRQQLERLGAL